MTFLNRSMQVNASIENQTKQVVHVWYTFYSMPRFHHPSVNNEVQSFFKDSKPNLFWNYNILKYDAHWQTH